MIQHTQCPLEAEIESALKHAGIEYLTEESNPTHMDFYLPALDIHIEVKGGFTSRVIRQMHRADNVIVAQGQTAVKFLASAIRSLK